MLIIIIGKLTYLRHGFALSTYTRKINNIVNKIKLVENIFLLQTITELKDKAKMCLKRLFTHEY